MYSERLGKPRAVGNSHGEKVANSPEQNVPFNIASYAYLTHMVAEQCDLEVGELIYTGGDVHLYKNHIEQARLQLTRTPFPLPKLVIKRKPESIFEYQFEDFEIVGYESHPHIKADVAV